MAAHPSTEADFRGRDGALTRGEWPALALLAVTVLVGMMAATAFILSVHALVVILVVVGASAAGALLVLGRLRHL